MNILVLAAHPDDEILGCGGLMARSAAEGHRVHLAIFGEGISSRYAKRSAASRTLLARLRRDSREAAKILGVSAPRFFDLPDNRFDTVPLLDIIKRIEALIAETKPDAVYTQHGGDCNVDHQVLFKATLAATRPVPGSGVRRVYAYYVASSTDWAFRQFAPEFRPTTFVDIAPYLEKKIAAMAAYSTELRDFPHPRSLRSLRALAESYGGMAGLEAAEPFQLVREVV